MFDFFAALGDALYNGLNGAIQLIQAIVQYLLFLVTVIYQVLVAVVQFLEKAFGILLRAVKHILSDIIHGRFLHLYEDYLRLKARLKKWFEDHLGWLLRLRKAFDDWYRHTIIPILNMIQRIRAILAIFRIFHLKFAQKLDDLLGALEAKIIKNTLALRGKLNEIVSILELVLDPSLLIRDNVFLASAARAIRGLFNALGLGFGRKLTTAEQASLDVDRKRYTVDQQLADAQYYKTTGPSPELLDREQQARDALDELVGVPLRKL